MDMLTENNFNALFYRESPVRTKSKNSAPTYYGKSSNVTNSLLANDSEIYGTVKNSLISRRNLILKYAKINHSIVIQGCFIDVGVQLYYLIIDKRVYV